MTEGSLRKREFVLASGSRGEESIKAGKAQQPGQEADHAFIHT